MLTFAGKSKAAASVNSGKATGASLRHGRGVKSLLRSARMSIPGGSAIHTKLKPNKDEDRVVKGSDRMSSEKQQYACSSGNQCAACRVSNSKLSQSLFYSEKSRDNNIKVSGQLVMPSDESRNRLESARSILLPKFSGFPVTYFILLNAAIANAIGKLKLCAGKENRDNKFLPGFTPSELEEIIKIIKSSSFEYQPDIRDCGFTIKSSNTIYLGPYAFDQNSCCALESTIAHEASHLMSGSISQRLSEKGARRLEDLCFDCESPSSIRQEKKAKRQLLREIRKNNKREKKNEGYVLSQEQKPQEDKVQAHNIIIAFDGAGSSTLSENREIKKLADALSAKLFDAKALTGAAIGRIADYVCKRLEGSPDSKVYIFGYSAGGHAAIKLVNKLTKMSLGNKVGGMVTFDPHNPRKLFGSSTYTLSNSTVQVANYYQKKKAFPGSDNPFKGGVVNCNNCTNTNLTINNNITHLNIVSFVLSKYKGKIKSILGAQ